MFDRARALGILAAGAALAAIVACGAFHAADGEPAPTTVEDGGHDGAAPGADGGVPPASGRPAGNLGTWTFDTAEACAGWAAYNATFTWVPDGRGGSGACRLCPEGNTRSSPNAEVPLPTPTTTEVFSITGYVKALDPASPTAQLGLYPRDANGVNVGSLGGSSDVPPTTTWTQSNVKLLTVGPDAGVETVFAQLALVGAKGTCADFDDVTIKAVPK